MNYWRSIFIESKLLTKRISGKAEGIHRKEKNRVEEKKEILFN